MSKKEHLLNHYVEALTSLCQVPDKDGKIWLKWPEEEPGAFYKQETAVDIIDADGNTVSKTLVLPTDEAIKRNDQGVVYFHPLSENIIRGESEIVKSMRTMIRFRINATALTIMEIITELASDETKHKSMSSQQQIVLKCFAGATKKVKQDIKNVLDAYFDKITGLYLKRKHTIDGDVYRRVASITFPLRAMIKEGSKTVGEHEMSSIKNAQVLGELIDYVFPKNEDSVLWSAGSNSDAAPYYESMLLVYSSVAERLNKLIKVFKKHIPNAESLMIPIDFKVGLQNLDDWKIIMRPLDGNIGAVLRGEKEIIPMNDNPVSSKVNMSKHLELGAKTTINTPPAPPVTPPASSANNTPPMVGSMPTAHKPAAGGMGKSWAEIKAQQGIAPSNHYSQPTYNPNTMLSPQQQMGMYPQQQMGMYPQQQMGMYPQQQMGMYPQQQQSLNYQQPYQTNNMGFRGF